MVIQSLKLNYHASYYGDGLNDKKHLLPRIENVGSVGTLKVKYNF